MDNKILKSGISFRQEINFLFKRNLRYLITHTKLFQKSILVRSFDRNKIILRIFLYFNSKFYEESFLY
jgi:hypothetical protein